MLSDIHANPGALAAVLRAADAAGAEEILCLGDVVGYYAEPDACAALLRERGARGILGNHDLAVLGWKDPGDFGALARQAVRWTRARLADETRRYLLSLPPHLLLPECLLIHGALHPRPNADLHLSTAARVRHSLRRLRDDGYGVPIGFFGHTHRAAIHELRGDAVLTHEGSVELRPGSHYLINPGSVGQPRDGDPRPSFAIFDTRAAEVRLHRVEHDHAPCLARAAAAGLLRPPPPEGPLERGRRRVARIFQRGLEVLERLERRGWP